MHLDRTVLRQRQADIRFRFIAADARVDLSQLLLQVVVGLSHRQSAQVHRSQVLHIDVAVGRDRLLNGRLRSAPDVDHHLIARAQLIVGRCRQVIACLEGHILVLEDAVSEDLLLLLLAHHIHHRRVGEEESELTRHHLLALHRVHLVLFLLGTLQLHGTVLCRSLACPVLLGHGSAHTGRLPVLHFPLDAVHLVHGHALAQQVLGYLLLALALFLGSHHIFNHLVIGHFLCRHHAYT